MNAPQTLPTPARSKAEALGSGRLIVLDARHDWRQSPEAYEATSAAIKADLTAGITNSYARQRVEQACDDMARAMRPMMARK